MQSIHLSRALIHRLICISEAIKSSTEMTQEMMEECVALRGRVVDRLEDAFNKIRSSLITINSDYKLLQADLDQCFALLMDGPIKSGALAVLQSKEAFIRLKETDLQQLGTISAGVASLPLILESLTIENDIKFEPSQQKVAISAPHQMQLQYPRPDGLLGMNYPDNAFTSPAYTSPTSRQSDQHNLSNLTTSRPSSSVAVPSLPAFNWHAFSALLDRQQAPAAIQGRPTAYDLRPHPKNDGINFSDPYIHLASQSYAANILDAQSYGPFLLLTVAVSDLASFPTPSSLYGIHSRQGAKSRNTPAVDRSIVELPLSSPVVSTTSILSTFPIVNNVPLSSRVAALSEKKRRMFEQACGDRWKPSPSSDSSNDTSQSAAILTHEEQVVARKQLEEDNKLVEDFYALIGSEELATQSVIPDSLVRPILKATSLPGRKSVTTGYLCQWAGCSRDIIKRLDHAKNHVREHCQSKPYTCGGLESGSKGCGGKFLRMDDLNRHQNRHCNVLKPSSSRRPRLVRNSDDYEDEDDEEDNTAILSRGLDVDYIPGPKSASSSSFMSTTRRLATKLQKERSQVVIEPSLSLSIPMEEDNDDHHMVHSGQLGTSNTSGAPISVTDGVDSREEPPRLSIDDLFRLHSDPQVSHAKNREVPLSNSFDAPRIVSGENAKNIKEIQTQPSTTAADTPGTSSVATIRMRKREITERTKIHKGSEHTIQAAILQVMGSRKTLSYQTLIQEVNSELSQRFTPTHIAKVVEDMLVKKQIEHAEGQPDTLIRGTYGFLEL